MVTNLDDSGDGSLRAAVQAADATSGADIEFANGLSGTIKLTSGELDLTSNMIINGPGADQLAVSGSSQSRVFNIGSGGSGVVTVMLTGLTISDGRAAIGAGLNAVNSNVLVSHSTLTGNKAADGTGGAGFGGAIASSMGDVNVVQSTFTDNTAQGGNGSNGSSAFVVGNGGAGGAGGGGTGGALYVNGGTVELIQDEFTGNVAQGGNGGNGGNGGSQLGAGGNGGAAGRGLGGAIALSNNVIAQLIQDDFSDNVAVGGSGGKGGNGGLFISNGGNGGAGGLGSGGAINLAGSSLLAVQNTFNGNGAIGGDGGNGGSGNLISVIGLPRKAGDGGRGGDGLGGGIASSGSTLDLIHPTLSSDQAIGGTGGNGGPQFNGNGGNGGNGQGGGIYTNSSTVTIIGGGFTLDGASGGGAGHGGTAGHGGVTGQGVGGAMYIVDGAVRIHKNTDIEADFASTSDPDVFGPYST
jgi:hypothetical protein